MSADDAVPADDDILSAEIVWEDTGQVPAPLAHVPHPLDAPEPEPAAVAAAAAAAFSPRRTMADMLQSFMEEKNIRWGELASGILIVGSAIGLVISLRAKLAEISEQIQYFPALLFMLGTVAIHAAGLYTLRRWKLRSTSRGVLIIATLLVPLSFAAGIVLSGAGENRTPVTSPFYIVAVLVGILGYGAVTTFSARALFSEGWWRLTIAVIGTSAGQLLINRLADIKSSWPLAAATALFALPLGSFLAATLSQLHVVSLKQRLTPSRAAQSYTVLGIAAFALAVPLGLQAWVSGTVRDTFTLLSPSLSVAATVVLSLGVAIQRRCDAKRMAETRTVGYRPGDPGRDADAGDVDHGLALSAGLDRGRRGDRAGPRLAGHRGATARLARRRNGGSFVCHPAAVPSPLRPVRHARGPARTGFDPCPVDGRSALVLLVLALIGGTIGALLLTRKRTSEGHVYLASAAGVAVVSLAIALYAGFWSDVDGDWTTLIFALYATSVLAASPRIRREWVTALGSALALITLIHLCQFNEWFAGRLAEADCSLTQPLLFSVIAHGLLVALIGLGLLAWRQLRGSHTDQRNKRNIPDASAPAIGHLGGLHRCFDRPLRIERPVERIWRARPVCGMYRRHLGCLGSHLSRRTLGHGIPRRRYRRHRFWDSRICRASNLVAVSPGGPAALAMATVGVEYLVCCVHCRTSGLPTLASCSPTAQTCLALHRSTSARSSPSGSRLRRHRRLWHRSVSGVGILVGRGPTGSRHVAYRCPPVR